MPLPCGGRANARSVEGSANDLHFLGRPSSPLWPASSRRNWSRSRFNSFNETRNCANSCAKSHGTVGGGTEVRTPSASSRRTRNRPSAWEMQLGLGHRQRGSGLLRFLKIFLRLFLCPLQESFRGADTILDWSQLRARARFRASCNALVRSVPGLVWFVVQFVSHDRPWAGTGSGC